jgi:hypothetical protein
MPFILGVLGWVFCLLCSATDQMHGLATIDTIVVGLLPFI